jgi:hypothetical protein
VICAIPERYPLGGFVGVRDPALWCAVARRQDSSLDPLRDAAGHLLADGEVAGSFVTWVSPFWGLAHPFRLQERVWMTIEWADGQCDEEIEDYEPWAFVDELRSGSLEWADHPHGGQYRVQWVAGDPKTALLRRLHPAHRKRE